MGKKHMNYVYLFFKAKLGLFFVYFRPFLNTMTIIVQNLTVMEEAKIMCLGSNPGPQDGGHRRIHWAFAAPHVNLFYCLTVFFVVDFTF